MSEQFLTEEHNSDGHLAVSRLSGTYNSVIHEVHAIMWTECVELHRLMTHTSAAQEHFSLSAAEMDALTDAWTQFKDNVAAWETTEQERGIVEKALEASRQADVWREVYRLGATVPGLEVIAREVEDYDTGKAEKRTVYDVKLASVGHNHRDFYTVDQVLKDVQEAIEKYNIALSYAEFDEKTGFIPDSSRSRANDIILKKDFLSQHRAWLATQQQEKPCKEVAQA